jgi:hypothetical protein
MIVTLRGGAAFVRILATSLVALFHYRNMLVRVRIIDYIARALIAEPFHEEPGFHLGY